MSAAMSGAGDNSVPSRVTGNPTGLGPVDAGSTPASATTPMWIERDGKRVWSEGWQANRGVPYTPGMVATLRFYADDHLTKVQKYNDDPERVGPEKCPESVWVMADRLLAAMTKERDALVRERDAAVALLGPLERALRAVVGNDCMSHFEYEPTCEVCASLRLLADNAAKRGG